MCSFIESSIVFLLTDRQFLPLIFSYFSSNIVISGEAEDGEIGPGQIFAPFLAMEDLLDKLKLLNYEKELVLKMRMRPLNRQADLDKLA